MASSRRGLTVGLVAVLLAPDVFDMNAGRSGHVTLEGQPSSAWVVDTRSGDVNVRLITTLRSIELRHAETERHGQHEGHRHAVQHER